MSNKILLFFLSILLLSGAMSGQIKVGDNPTIINPNSILELESPNQGLLMPRIALTATTNAAPLNAHIAGMTVYNIAMQNDVTPGFYYNDGVKWIKFLGQGALNGPIVIGTGNINTLSITGLGASNPNTDEIITVDPVTGIVRKSPISLLIKEEQMTYMANEGQTLFSTPMPITDIDKINVYRNGARIGIVMINVTTIALEPGIVCVVGDEIRIVQIN